MWRTQDEQRASRRSAQVPAEEASDDSGSGEVKASGETTSKEETTEATGNDSSEAVA